MKKTRIRDGAGTQAKILKAAEKLFSENGFNGTSIGKISKESGISDGLILHHYKTKDNLYQAVREQVASRYQLVLQGETDSGSSGVGSEGTILQLFEAVFNFFKNNWTYHRISLWSYLEGKADVVENESVITGNMMDIVRDGQEAGVLADDFDPVVFLTMTGGAIYYWLRYRDQFKKILNYKESLAELDQRFIEQTAILLRRSVITTENK